MDLYLSTIGKDAAALAREYGFGIEIAEFGYAANMDEDFEHWESVVLDNLAGIERRIFHAPYSELCPAAIDPLILDVTKRRLKQAYDLAHRFGVSRMVVHSGYVPGIYYMEWFMERSIAFWREYLCDKPPDFTLLLENVMEEDPYMLREIVEKTGDSRFQLCLDIGHAGKSPSSPPLEQWIEAAAPYLRHVHVHNNYRTLDLHNPPGDGLIDVRAALNGILELGSDISYTIETADLKPAVSWLIECGFIVP